MKALNRAIARTVSQIARHAGEGCHVPMIMALENHLDALLTMERKMLDGVQEVVASTGRADGKSVADWMRELERVKAPIQHANENAQPAPDVIDMTDPRNWQVGDVVVCKERGMISYGKEFIVAAIDGNEVSLSGGNGDVLRIFDAGDYFTWLRHGEVQS